MKTSVSWLLSYTDIDKNIDVHKLASDMTISGTKVETVEKQGEEIHRVVVGKCTSVRPHENSDHLQICEVDVGNETLQIVTGAPNVRADALIPVALNNSTIAGGKKIKNGKLRGVESCGMMCSFEELGLDYADYEGGIGDGIIILEDLSDFRDLDDAQKRALIGKDIMEVLGAGETVIDFEVTSNRADCFSVLGLALGGRCDGRRAFRQAFGVRKRGRR